MKNTGEYCFNLAEKLWPICRSITGQGIRTSLEIIQKEIPSFMIKEVQTGEKCFDWIVPKEWNISEGYIKDATGNKILDFKNNNLHVVGYSTPVNKIISLKDLQTHLHSIELLPNAVPYVTSYYDEYWGFCISHKQRESLHDGNYQVYIASSLKNGVLNYGELLIPGKSSQEIFLSTYLCHPSMANNELSGPVVVTALAKYLQSRSNYYSYRVIFIPETIGSIVYLSKNLQELKKNVVAGFNITCVGDDRCYSYLPSRNGNSLSDLVARHVLNHIDKNFIEYPWSARGSDERQYCSPGIDLPIASMMRSKYGEYPEYHTSLDTLGGVVTKVGLEKSVNMYVRAIELLENYSRPKALFLCEPQLGKRGLYNNLSKINSANNSNIIMELLTWSDGNTSIIEIADKCGIPAWELYPIISQLKSHNLISIN